MIVQHRLIGNIPGRGHGDPLLSPAFPLDSALTTTTAYRAPDPGYVPTHAGRISDDGKYHIHLTTFEIQSTHFGRPVLISSNIFRPANTTVRPMIYMNTVAITEENGAAPDSLSPDELLSFGEFITPAYFASLNATSSSLSAGIWSPSKLPQRTPFFAPNSAAHRALLGRYWAAASSRVFGGNAQVFSICLGPQTACETIIENAKALLLCDILPHLPAAVRGIVSMSACVLESSVRTVFKDSAMAVIFPTAFSEPQQPTFDLRRKDGYPVLSKLEDQFIACVLNGGCAFMRGILDRYMTLPGSSDPTLASFAADYDVSLLLYQLERTLIHGEKLIPDDKLIAAWKMLNSLLVNRHHLTDDQVNHLLADVESKLFSLLPDHQAALDAIGPSDLPALWQKALTVDDALFPHFASVVALSPVASSFLSMLESASRLDSKKTARTAALISRICETHYTREPFSADQVAQLTAEPMFTLLQSSPEICSALSEGLRRSNEAFTNHQLLTLPLSSLLLDGRQVLEDAVKLLREQFVERLPSAEQTGNFAAVYNRLADERITHQLYDYFAACLPLQLNNLASLCTMIASILPKTDDATAVLLRSAQHHGIFLDSAQTSALFDLLLPKCTQPSKLAQAYADYERGTAAAVSESPSNRLARLCICAGVLSRISYDATDAVAAIFSSFAAEDIPLTAQQSEAFLRSLWPLCHDGRITADAFGNYFSALAAHNPIRYFTNPDLCSGMIPLVAHFKTDLTNSVTLMLNAAMSENLHAPVIQIDQFFSIFLSHCENASAIARQLISYVEASVSQAQSSSNDLFPWLCSMVDLTQKHHLFTHAQPFELAHMAVRYLCSRCNERSCPPNETAFKWLNDFAVQSPAAFSEISPAILSLYNDLLSKNAGSATADQLLYLLRYFGSTANYPSVCELDRSATCASFCKVLSEQGYDAAFAAAAHAMTRCAMSEEELLTRTQKESRAALERQFSAYRKISQFEQAHRTSSASRDQLFNAVLKESFVKMKDSYAGKQLSIDQMDRLNSASSLFGVGTNDIPQLLRTMSELICLPIYDGSSFVQCLDILRTHQLDPTAISKELLSLINDSLPYLNYPQNVYAAMLCSLTANTKNAKWKNVFSLLGVSVPEKMPKPFSGEGQALLAFIHAVFRALDLLEQYPGCSYGRQLIDYLSREDFEDFSDSVLSSNPKRLACVYPEYPRRSPLLSQWLSR